MDDDKTVKTLEEIAGKTFNTEAEKHKAAIRDLPDARREAYRKLRRQAAKPEPEELELPDIYETVIDEDSLFSDHLYADEEARVPKSLGSSKKPASRRFPTAGERATGAATSFAQRLRGSCDAATLGSYCRLLTASEQRSQCREGRER